MGRPPASAHFVVPRALHAAARFDGARLCSRGGLLPGFLAPPTPFDFFAEAFPFVSSSFGPEFFEEFARLSRPLPLEGQAARVLNLLLPRGACLSKSLVWIGSFLQRQLVPNPLG